jgi:transposase
MEEGLLERCCGLDVHSRVVVACLLSPTVEGGREVRSFGTTTRELLALGDWLEAADCKDLAMESTGSYWKPVYNLLEGRFQLTVVNSRYLKMLPGRKSDVRDAEWIAWLLQRGMLKASAIPSREERELRELSRYRTSLVQERAAEVNRIQKVLEGANLKLGTVVSDITGASGRAMLERLAAGVADPGELAALARGRLRSKSEAVREALVGAAGPHQRFLLRQQLGHIDDLDRRIDEVEREVERRTRPFAEVLARLQSIPGVGPKTASLLLAEVGFDFRHFSDGRRLASWAGLCPGQDESAGRRRSSRTTKGSRWLRAALVQAAHAAARSRSALGSRYRRLAGRIGKQKAAVAIAHQILVIAFAVVTRNQTYEDAKAEPRSPVDLAQVYIRKLEKLGYAVSTRPAA